MRGCIRHVILDSWSFMTFGKCQNFDIFFEGLALEFSTGIISKTSRLLFLILDLPSLMRPKPGGTFGKFIVKVSES